MSRHMTPKEVAELCRVTPDKVLDWIHDGALLAVNLARHAGGKARWRVSHDDLRDFLRRRRSQPPAPAPKRKRRQPENVTQYY
ncbi:MAG TPA: helix-turn-helix domain-containing protein [Pirellulaceae bacterium]|nr:helix-turn-helix domain-containing protein [Pirellulaceae bacterium]